MSLDKLRDWRKINLTRDRRSYSADLSTRLCALSETFKVGKADTADMSL